MGHLSTWSFSTVCCMLVQMLGAIDFGSNVYKEDVLYQAIGNGGASEGFVSYFDPASPRKYQFTTENTNLAVTKSLSNSVASASFVRLSRTSSATQPQIMILIVRFRELQVLSVAPSNKGDLLYTKTLLDSTDTTTKCIHAYALDEFIYVLCLKPGAKITEDVYSVKSYKYVNGLATDEASYAFSPAADSGALTMTQAVIRVAPHSSFGIQVLLFNRINLQSLATSGVDNTGANTKFLYIVDYKSNAAKKELFNDLTTVTKKGGTDKLSDFGLVYDARGIMVGTSNRLHLLTSSGTTKVPSLFTFDYAGTAGQRTVVNWEVEPTLALETATYSADLCHNLNANCVRGVTSTSPKKSFHYSYTLDNTDATVDVLGKETYLKTWNDVYPIRFEDCDVSTVFSFCTNVYSEIANPADGSPNLAYFELFQIDRTTPAAPVVNVDRVSRSAASVGAFHEYSTKAAASIAERRNYFLYLLSDATATNNKLNYMVLDTFRFTTVGTAVAQQVTAVKTNEGTTSAVDVTFTPKDFLSTVTAPMTSIKSSMSAGKWRPVPLNTDATGQALRLSVTGTGVESLIFQDPEIDLADPNQNAIDTSNTFVYYFGNIVLTLPKTQPATLKVYNCTSIKSYTSTKIKGNCSYLTEQATFTGALVKTRALTPDQAVLLFKASATSFPVITIKGATLKQSIITDSIIDGDFWLKTNGDGTTSSYLGYIYTKDSKFAAKVMKLDSDGGSLTAVVASDEAATIFTNPLQVIGFYSETSLAVLDIHATTFQHSVITLKQDPGTPTKLIQDTLFSFWRQGIRESTEMKACFYPDPIGRLVYWYPASKIGGIANIKNDFELLSFGLTELGVTEIQTIACEYSAKKSFVLVGKAAAGTGSKSVAYVYKMNSIAGASSRLETYYADLAVVYDPVIPIYNVSSGGGRWCFSGYSSNKGLARTLLSPPEVYIKQSTAGDFTFNLVAANSQKTATSTAITFSSLAYDQSNLKLVLGTGSDIETNKNFSVDSLINLQAMPVMTLDLDSSNSFIKSLLKLFPRLIFSSNLEKTTTRRILTEAAADRRRVLQGSTINVPLFMIVKDGITLVVFKFSTGTKGYIYKQTDTFTKNFDFPGGAALDIKVLDFKAEAAGTGTLHIFYHLGDNKLKYLKVGIEKLDTTFTEIDVQDVGALQLTTLVLTSNTKYDSFMIFTYAKKDSEFNIWGVKITGNSAAFVNRIKISSKFL